MVREILLGDNPFFGIDHLSQENARKRIIQLDSFEKITNVIEYVNSQGVNGFVVSTHPELKEIIKYMENNTNILKKMDFLPILPYAQGYVMKTTQLGITGAINEVLSGITIKNKFRILVKGSLGYLQKDFEKLLRTFIDTELYHLYKVKKRRVYLHDVITDVALGLNMKNIIEIFLNHIHDHHKIETGLVTKNFPLLLKRLDDWKIDVPNIMTSFNPVGYQMNPSKGECEKQLTKFDNVVAMNVLAGGYVTPKESAKYVSEKKLKAVVIGMSNIEHAKETINAFVNMK